MVRNETAYAKIGRSNRGAMERWVERMGDSSDPENFKFTR